MEEDNREDRLWEEDGSGEERLYGEEEMMGV